MNKIIYLEADTEITAVIDRIKATDTDGVVLVLPRGSTLTQSIVNLKLLKRVADGLGKTIFLAINDKVTTNLARQVGIQVFSKASDAERAEPRVIEKEEEFEGEEDVDPTLRSLIKVKTYNRFGTEEDKPTQREDNVFGYEDEEEAMAAEEIDDSAENTVDEENIPHEPISQYQAEDESDESMEEEAPIVAPKVMLREETAKAAKEEPRADNTDEFEDEDEPEEDETPKIEKKPMLKKEIIAPVFVTQEKSGKFDSNEPIKKSRKNHKFALIAGTLLILILLIFAGLFYIFVPYTTASMILKTDEYKKDFEFLVDKNTNTNSSVNSMPGELVSVEKEQTKKYAATGKKDAGAKATGTVTFSNSLSSDEQLVGAGTKLTSSDGKVFVLQNAVKIPGATVSSSSCKLVGTTIQCDTVPGTVDGTVFANANGIEYNLAPTKFSVAGFSAKVSAESKAAFTGGISKQIQIVTDSDLANAEKDLQAEIITSLKTDLKKAMDDKKYQYFEETISSDIVSIGTDKKSGDEATEFEYKVKANLVAIGFIESQAKDDIIQIAGNDLGDGKMLVNPDPSQVTLSLVEGNNDTGILKLKASITGRSGEEIDQEQIRQKIKNKKEGDALNIVKSLPGVADATINNWPSRLPITAFLSSHVIIKFDYSTE